MASPARARDEIRAWVQERGGIPTVVKRTEAWVRSDFVEGAGSGGREARLPWETAEQSAGR